MYGGNDPRRADGSTALYASSASLPASLRDMRLFATAASLHSWDIKAGDVTGAYLNATAPQDSFVTLSEEMIDHLLSPADAAKYRRIAAEGSKASPKYYPVVELKKALYGHTQAGFLWEAEARKQLLAMGFVNFPDVSSAWYVHYTDPKDGSEPKVDCMLLLYVDDFLIAGNNHACNRIISLMKEIWTLKGGDVHSINDAPIIGTQFTQTFVPDGDDAPLVNVGIDQRAYAAHAFAEFQGATGCPEQDLPKRGIDTPIIDGEQNVLLRGPDGKVPPGTWTPGAYAKHAAKIVGILMWLCRTGYFHLTVAVYSVAREVGNWTETVDRQVRRIFAHIRARPDGVLLLRVSPKDLKEDKLKLLIFSDADHAGNVSTRRSVSGVGIVLSGPNGTWAMLDWISRSQRTISLSTAEAELLAAQLALREALSLLIVLDILRIPVDLELLVDSAAALSVLLTGLSSKLRYSAKSQGLGVGWCAQMIKDFGIRARKVATDHNIADIFTKAVAPFTFKSLVKLSGWTVPGDLKKRRCAGRHPAPTHDEDVRCLNFVEGKETLCADCRSPGGCRCFNEASRWDQRAKDDEAIQRIPMESTQELDP